MRKHADPDPKHCFYHRFMFLFSPIISLNLDPVKTMRTRIRSGYTAPSCDTSGGGRRQELVDASPKDQNLCQYLYTTSPPSHPQMSRKGCEA